MDHRYLCPPTLIAVRVKSGGKLAAKLAFLASTDVYRNSTSVQSHRTEVERKVWKYKMKLIYDPNNYGAQHSFIRFYYKCHWFRNINTLRLFDEEFRNDMSANINTAFAF